MKILSAALIATALLTGAAHAATFDFAKMANDFKYNASNTTLREGTFTQLQAGLPGVFSDGGVTITSITAGGSNTQTNPAHPFFDGSGSATQARNGQDLAGLGVCSSGFSATRTVFTGTAMSQCSSNGGSNTSDDNAQRTEYAMIAFDRIVSITGSLWRDANHQLFSGTLDYDSGAGWLGTLSVTNGLISAVNGGAGLGALDLFGFRVNGASSPDREVYLSVLSVQAVPLPASVLLLAVGLAGLGAMRRKRA